MMKNKISLFLLLCILGVNAVFSQISDSNWKYLLVRDDVVNPSLTTSYEASLMDLSIFLAENDVQEVNYLTQLQDNYHYTHISVLNDLNDIGGGMRAFIKGERNSAEFNLIWDDLNETIESYNYYVVEYVAGLSFVPDGKVWLDEQPYRKWNYYYFQPGKEKEVNAVLLAWKNLYQNKGVKHGYRVFKGVIGLEQPVVIFTTWAESPLDHQIYLQENMNLLGDEGSILWMSMMKLVRKVETVEGWYLPQYSYLPQTIEK